MTKHPSGHEISRIEKRAIEAQAIAPIIEALSAAIGENEALKILSHVNQQEAFERGRKLSRTSGLDVIGELVKDVATWGEGGPWEMEILQQTSATYFFNVHRCPYHEKYLELGLGHIGAHLSCCRDEAFARGLDSRLSLSRTQTIMEGADYCDFRYVLNE